MNRKKEKEKEKKRYLSKRAARQCLIPVLMLI
jgi:hypothetical protein